MSRFGSEAHASCPMVAAAMPAAASSRNCRLVAAADEIVGTPGRSLASTLGLGLLVGVCIRYSWLAGSTAFSKICVGERWLANPLSGRAMVAVRMAGRNRSQAVALPLASTEASRYRTATVL